MHTHNTDRPVAGALFAGAAADGAASQRLDTEFAMTLPSGADGFELAEGAGAPPRWCESATWFSTVAFVVAFVFAFCFSSMYCCNRAKAAWEARTSFTPAGER